MSSLVDENGNVVCEQCEVASRLGARMRGLLGRSGLDPGHGLLIEKTGSIHMFFMRFPIDAVFLDRNLEVRKVVRTLRPWRTAAALGARFVLELPAGEADRVGIKKGSRLAWRAAADAVEQP